MSDGIILLVEDNPDDVALTLRALKKSAIANELVVAHDGVQALDYLFGTGTYAGRNPAVPPALILLDLKLPKIDGLEVLRRLRADERTRFVSVVILTSSKEQRDIVEGYKLGVNAYVQKPVDFEQFSSVIEQVGMFWLVVNQPPPRQAFGV